MRLCSVASTPDLQVLEPDATRILLVEDDERIGSTLLRALQGSGYAAQWERCGVAGIRAAAMFRPALVLLDLGLPDVDGLDVCRSLRELDEATVIVMLTARDEELDVVVGLDAGAVDYIPKPFKLAELLARIRAQLRRSPPIAGDGAVAVAVAGANDLSVDEGARRAWLDGAEL
ncbi:MAG: chemotaxis protein CheY, partial [Ilumatobacteraceae bacterium]|nr:chemotaxis protein CheY [Ilumatobacteraceae bacterium]